MPEVAWRKSSYSVQENSECVELAPGRVRDSKNPGPVLVVEPGAFAGFLTAVKAGIYGPSARHE
jgi:hypothetical protein